MVVRKAKYTVSVTQANQSSRYGIWRRQALAVRSVNEKRRCRAARRDKLGLYGQERKRTWWMPWQ